MSNFKLYEDKNSALHRTNRMTQGGTVDILKKRLGWWEKFDFSKKESDDITFVVEIQHQIRPDKISYDVYGRADLEWLILMYNNIVDINEELLAGTTLRLPSKQRVQYEILINQIRRID